MSSKDILPDNSLIPGEGPNGTPDSVYSSGMIAKTAFKLLAIIAVIETLIMIGLPYLQLGPWAETATDTTLLTIFSGICIWNMIILPERKRLQNSKQESIHFLRQHLDAINEFAIVTTTDLGGRINYANENFCKVSGYSVHELLGQPHSIINSGYHPKSFFTDMWGVISKGKIWRGQVCNRSKTGNIYWVDSNIIPIVNSDNKITKYLSFRFDITEEKRIEKELEEEKAKSIHMSRLSSLGEMAGGIAHEINNPLAIINGQLSIVVRKLKSFVDQGEAMALVKTIEKSQAQVFRITKIINGLREFSRSGDESPYESVSVQTILEAVESLCFEKVKKAMVEFKLQPIEAHLKCNPIQIEQVLVNLINNSVDAISSQSDKWIRVDSKVIGSFIEISVTDSGKGIAPEVAGKIMQPFFTTKELGKGTGLGLSISHGIIKKYGGTLELDTQSPNTRFVIMLPIDDAAIMSLINVDDAIKSHLNWKQRTLAAFAGQTESLDHKKLSADNLCALGVWIEKIQSRYEGNSQFHELRVAHTEFHSYVGTLALMANSRDSKFSEALFVDGSEFQRLSDRVIKALQEFREPYQSLKAA